jgi:hypothetical protein
MLVLLLCPQIITAFKYYCIVPSDMLIHIVSLLQVIKEKIVHELRRQEIQEQMNIYLHKYIFFLLR